MQNRLKEIRQEGEKVAKEFIKAQLPNILGEGEDDE